MTKLNKTCAALAALPLAALLAAPVARAQVPIAALPVFSITVLPAQVGGNALNRAGHVVGSGSPGVWLWNGIDAIQLPTGIPGYSDGLGINNRDDVAGTSYGGSGGGTAFANINGVPQNIGAAAPDFRSSYARKINDAGWVVGALYEGRGIESRPFIYSNGNIQVLPTLGGNAGAAFAVSNLGYVTGQAALPTTPPFSGGGNAFLYLNGRITGLGTLPGDDTSSGLDVNDNGEVVGVSSLTGQPGNRGFLFSRGRMVNLGSLGGTTTTAFAINNFGVVVGSANLATQEERGFIYARGRIVDLNRFINPRSGWVIGAALDINDAFQVLARACRTDVPQCGTVRLEPPALLRNGRLAEFIRLFSQ